MSNVSTLDTNVVTLLGFPATGKFQKSNLWDFYSLPSCSFFILTILDHLLTIYIKNNTGSKPFHTKNLLFKTFENIGTKNRKLSTMNRLLCTQGCSDTTEGFRGWQHMPIVAENKNKIPTKTHPRTPYSIKSSSTTKIRV